MALCRLTVALLSPRRKVRTSQPWQQGTGAVAFLEVTHVSKVRAGVTLTSVDFVEKNAELIPVSLDV